MEKLYIVTLHTHKWSAGTTFTPEERITLSLYRLSSKQKNQLHYLKVKFYREVSRLALCKLGESYVVREEDLPKIEMFFQQIEQEFIQLREKFYEEILTKWPEIERRLKEYLRKNGLPVSRINRLRPDSIENFLDLRYSVTPLDAAITGVYDLYEQFKNKANEVKEYAALAKRIKAEANKRILELKIQYDRKIEELTETIEKLKKAVKEKEKEVYKAKLMGLKRDAEALADLLETYGSEETIEDLRMKLEGLKEYFIT